MKPADLSALSAEDFQQGQLLLVDKPLGWTSFDAVHKIRFLIRHRYGLKKIKVGHAGTLDPLATGLLLICTGRFTKRIAELTGADKCYTGSMVLGATTPSYDLETEVGEVQDTDHLSAEDVSRAAAAMLGSSMQVPPQYSAKLVDGKRAYLSARVGKKVDIPARAIELYRFEVECQELPRVDFDICCSTGTYIRAIARDLGEALGCGAHLSSLRRHSVAEYEVKDALSIPDIEAALQP